MGGGGGGVAEVLIGEKALDRWTGLNKQCTNMIFCEHIEMFL